MEGELAFGVSPPDPEDRRRLLAQAADALDRRASHLGPGDEAAPATEEGQLVRMFAEDTAGLARPQIFRLATEAATADAPSVETHELARRNAHYWLSFPVVLWTRANRGFNRIEIKVGFDADDEQADRRPATVDAVPHQELVTRFKAGTSLALTVGTDLHFHAGLPDVPLKALGIPVSAGASAEVTAGATGTLQFAPSDYTIRVARVARSGLGADHVFWRLDRDAFVEENDPGLRVILRVPLPAERLRVSAQMIATRYSNLFGDGLRRAILDLPATLRDFVMGGTPIAATAAWDLSEEL